MVCSAWNPQQMNQMALPPCHVMWHVTVIDDKLNLCWFQRSCDLMLGFCLILHHTPFSQDELRRKLVLRLD